MKRQAPFVRTTERSRIRPGGPPLLWQIKTPMITPLVTIDPHTQRHCQQNDEAALLRGP